ncbi:MAG: enoyl-CoA hydratase-related protein [Candidatus Thermoplasmatota archaeon]
MECIEVKINNNFATLTLNRPEVHNAINETMILEITDAIKKLSQEKIRVVVLTGKGTSFCAGADINWLKRSIEYEEEENIADVTRLAKMFEELYNFPKPIIGRINGTAIGGGVGLVAVCDIAIATEKARFCFGEVRLGIAPVVISPYVVPKIGISSAMEFFLSSEFFSAEKAMDIGLINRVVKPEELDKAVEEKLKLLLSNAPTAIKEAKLFLRNFTSFTENIRDKGIKKLAELRRSKEGIEGIKAYLEKRKPYWLGEKNV